MNYQSVIKVWKSDIDLQGLVDSKSYSLFIVITAYIAVFLEPVILFWVLYNQAEKTLWLDVFFLVVNAVTALIFVFDFLVNFRLQGKKYLYYTSAWINILIFINFLSNLFSIVIPMNPAVLRLLRMTGVVARLGLLQKAGRLESNLASGEVFQNNEDDIKYSIVLILAFSLLSIHAVSRDYTSAWNPLLEIAVYLVVIIAVRFKVRRNWDRLTEKLVDPLKRLTTQNRDKLITLLGEEKVSRADEETLKQLLKEGKNEIDLIIEQVNQIFHHLKKFVSERTLRESRGETVIPADQSIAMSFSDIEGFTNATQAMKSEIIPVLALYLQTMSDNILKRGGDIEKFIGDAVFAYYYDRERPEHSANNAFDSVIDCINEVGKLWNEPEWKSLFAHGGWERFKNFKTRFGLHYGPVTAGPIGSLDEQLRMESTLVGDHVNITSRLEALGKHYGLYNLMSDDFYQQLSSDRKSRCRVVDYITVKGRADDPFRIYTIDTDTKPEGFLSKYELGLTAYFSGEWSQALEYFSSALEMEPGDSPSKAFVDRIESSKRFTLRAIDNISRKVEAQLETFSSIREQLEKAIENEPYIPPVEFIERGGYWRWDEK